MVMMPRAFITKSRVHFWDMPSPRQQPLLAMKKVWIEFYALVWVVLVPCKS